MPYLIVAACPARHGMIGGGDGGGPRSVFCPGRYYTHGDQCRNVSCLALYASWNDFLATAIQVFARSMKTCSCFWKGHVSRMSRLKFGVKTEINLRANDSIYLPDWGPCAPYPTFAKEKIASVTD